MIKVLIVDDSAVARLYLRTILESDDEIKIIGEATNGLEGVRKVRELTPDVVTMDIQMPVMDGIEAIRIIMAEQPTPIIVVSSSVNESETKVAFHALEAGALSIVEKPRTRNSGPMQNTKEEILRQLKLVRGIPLITRRSFEKSHFPAAKMETLIQRQSPQHPLEFLGIAASTGGPQTLHALLSKVTEPLPVPILAVQHIARGFVTGMVSWLDRNSVLRVKLAEDGEKPEAGTVYFSPDDTHLLIKRDKSISLSTAPPRMGFRPSGNVLFDSLASYAGQSSVGLVLTGMGDDGADGLCALSKAGGYVIAQDKASSIIFGMPRAAIERGIVNEIVSLDDIPKALLRLFEN